MAVHLPNRNETRNQDVNRSHILWLVLLAALLLCACAQPENDQTIHSGIFFHDEAGKPLTGWQEIDGSRYYLGPDGQAVVGIHTIDRQTYCFGSNGAMRTGWAKQDGKYFYLRSNGTMVTGWFSLEGQRFYLSEEGAATGIREIDGKPYVFAADGRLGKGWTRLENGLAYADANGHPLTGWQTLEGQTRHFSPEGVLSVGWTVIGSFRYYFFEDGSPAQGETFVDGELCHFASNGQELILVNPWHTLPEGYSVELTDIDKEFQVASIAYEDFLLMMDACEDAGMKPAVCSAYRTQKYQEELYQRRIERYIEDGRSEEEARTLAGQSVAVPGTSEHQLGLALDIVDSRNWNLDRSQAKMPTQKWLMDHSWRYGWILRYPDGKSSLTGIIYEPWHYRYVGREIAKEIYESGLCLEEYLDMLTPAVG